MNAKKRKYYEDIAKQKGKIALIEECNLSLSSQNLQLVEKVSLIEDTTGHKYEAVGVIKNVPISKYTENANGRIYSRPLWEEVKKKKMGEGSLCMADHPEDDQDSVKDIYGVWHDMKINEDMVTMDLYLVEEKPFRVLKAGGSIGTSSVGYGTLNESDGKTVDPLSFDLERASDLVVHPSQGTYARYENIHESIEIKENVEDTNNILIESQTNNSDNNILKENDNLEKDIKRNNKMLDKLTEASLKNQVRVAIKEAKTSVKMKDAIEDLKGIKDTIPVELTESHAKLDEAISEITSKLEEQLIDSGKVLKEKENALEEVMAKYQTTEQAYNKLKEDYKTAEALIAKLKESSDSKKTVELLESLKKDRELMSEDIKAFKEEIVKRDKDISIFMEERNDMLDDIKTYSLNEKKLKESLKTCQIAKKKVKEEDEEFSDIGSFGDADPEGLDLPEPDENVMDIDIEADAGDSYDMESDIESIDSLDDDELDAESLINEAEEDDEKEDDDDDDEEEMKEEEDSEEDKKEDEKEKEEKKESTKIKVNRDVYKHYEKAIKKNSALKDLKKQILTSKTLYEAVKLIESFEKRKKEKEALISLKEAGHSIPSKIEEYKFTR